MIRHTSSLEKRLGMSITLYDRWVENLAFLSWEYVGFFFFSLIISSDLQNISYEVMGAGQVCVICVSIILFSRCRSWSWSNYNQQKVKWQKPRHWLQISDCLFHLRVSPIRFFLCRFWEYVFFVVGLLICILIVW